MTTIADIRYDMNVIAIGGEATEDTPNRVYEGLMIKGEDANIEADIYLALQYSSSPDKDLYDSLNQLGWWSDVNTEECFQNNSAIFDIDQNGPIISLERQIECDTQKRGLIIGFSDNDLTDIYLDIPDTQEYLNDKNLKESLKALNWWNDVNV